MNHLTETVETLKSNIFSLLGHTKDIILIVSIMADKIYSVATETSHTVRTTLKNLIETQKTLDFHSPEFTENYFEISAIYQDESMLASMNGYAIAVSKIMRSLPKDDRIYLLGLQMAQRASHAMTPSVSRNSFHENPILATASLVFKSISSMPLGSQSILHIDPQQFDPLLALVTRQLQPKLSTHSANSSTSVGQVVAQGPRQLHVQRLKNGDTLIAYYNVSGQMNVMKIPFETFNSLQLTNGF